jgi:hypothetical protein
LFQSSAAWGRISFLHLREHIKLLLFNHMSIFTPQRNAETSPHETAGCSEEDEVAQSKKKFDNGGLYDSCNLKGILYLLSAPDGLYCAITAILVAAP